MPSRRLPNTQVTVLRTLTAARDAWKQFPTDRLITSAHWAKLDDAAPASFLNRLLKETGDVQTALAAQAPATSALTEAIDRLALHISHFHQVYDLGVARGVFTAAGRAHYDRDFTASTLPDLSTIPAILAAGARIAPGEAARATAEGAAHVPMALPGAAQVAALHADAAAKRAASETAKLTTDTEQGQAAGLYPEAHALAVSILNTVEFQLSERPELDAPGRRRIARAWGAVYVNDDGTVSEEPVPQP
ncbi:MAG: hypothetical protein V4584_15080 [Verrucomicrobiota bacterium]